jgi:Tol biopolymer transport system component
MAAPCLALLTVGAGCGTDAPATRAVAATRLHRPELVVFRVGGPVNRVAYSLVAVNARGRILRVLQSGTEHARRRPALFEPASWSPNGRRLAFTAELGRILGSCRRDIYVMSADGSRARRVTSGGRSFHPVWAPGGRRIVFARSAGVPCSHRTSTTIWSMRPNGTDQQPLTEVVTGRVEVPGSFSPDGATLAFTRGAFEGPGKGGRLRNAREVWAMRPDGSGARRLAERAADPAFSPNGRQIAFASDRDENGELSYGDVVFFANELYAMDSDGSSPRRLTRSRDLNEGQPSWLPTGTRIAYQRGRVTGNAQGTVVLQANADGTSPKRVLGDRRLDTWYAAPVWRPR